MTTTDTDRDLTDLVSIPELARLWSVSRATVHRWIREGELDAVRVGKRRKVTRESALAFLDRCTEDA